MFAPLVLWIAATIHLWAKPHLFFMYQTGITLNMVLNVVLKLFFQQPRPSSDKYTQAFALAHAHKLYRSIYPIDQYGMPSGHAQNVVFTSVFLLLTERRLTCFIWAVLGVAGICMVQRVVSHRHTELQVFLGSLVGAAMAWIFYKGAEKNIRSRLTTT
jgi:membrane-associated phospholipid phosphatase